MQTDSNPPVILTATKEGVGMVIIGVQTDLDSVNTHGVSAAELSPQEARDYAAGLVKAADEVDFTLKVTKGLFSKGDC